MRLVDSHPHLFLDEFQSDLQQVMARAQAAGVAHIFVPNIDSTTVEPMLRVCSEYRGYCFPMMGLHPTSVNADYKKELAIVSEHLTTLNDCMTIGEIGMDLYWDKTFLKEQQFVFEQQIQWTLEYELSIVIHCREVFDYIYNVLKPYKISPLKGIFHSFTGTLEGALRILESPDLSIGINDVVTFKKSNSPEVLSSIPLARIVLEADSPYLIPVPNRGRRNKSANVKDILLKVAKIYGKPPEEVGCITSENVLRVPGILK